MMDYEEYDPMEYEYTSPIQTSLPSRYYRAPREIYVPPPAGSFPIPESFFEKQYNKTTAVANKVADAFMSFSISDPEEQEEKNSSDASESTQEEEEDPLPKLDSVNNALALYSPPKSPRQPAIEASSSNQSKYNTSSSVDQNVTPNSPTSSPSNSFNSSTSYPTTTPNLLHSIAPETSSMFPLNPTPNYNPSFIHSPRYQPAYIHYYPEPVNPMDESQGKMHVIQGLFRLAVITVVLSAVSYTLFYVGLNLNRDVMEKVSNYESEFFTKQMSCRNSYEDNRCSSNTRFPAIMEMCQEWERCMYSPLITRRSQALAETIADMANGFSENLTPKTMVMCVAIVLIMIWGLVKVLMGHPTPAPLPTPPSPERKELKRNSKLESLCFEEGSPFI